VKAALNELMLCASSVQTQPVHLLRAHSYYLHPSKLKRQERSSGNGKVSGMPGIVKSVLLLDITDHDGALKTASKPALIYCLKIN
jgi:hypothetical protein